MASSSVSQEDVETDFMLSCRRSRIRIARARNPPQHAARLVTGYEEHTVDDRDNKDRGRIGRLDRSKGKAAPRDRRKLREKRRSTGVVHLQSTESTGGSTAEDEGEFSPGREETRRNTVANESPFPDNGKPEGRPFQSRRTESPSDLEADDEDTQDCDSVSKLDREMASLELVTSTVSDKVTSTVPDQSDDSLTVALSKALVEIESLRHQLAESRREVSVLKLEREALMLQQLSNRR